MLSLPPTHNLGWCTLSLLELFFRAFLSHEEGLSASLPVCSPLSVVLRWAACAVCLATCQINAGVLWSHLKKEVLHVKRRDGAQLDLTDGWIIHCKQLSCEVRIFFGWELFGNRLWLLCLHDIFMCWCKHAWTQGHLCTLHFSNWLSIIFLQGQMID